ncbi:unnamed protein product [Danaus chrysippus]|uniref:(African queen) hypothetical protein n=1 Tax=Danaus chrysippus TaxID=151541 RepID=A0A8J2WBM0_9NEOP|nr:unnamed protein product [Danaus chrysippus]
MSDVTENGKKFKNIRETYKISTFLLTLGLMYPNPVYDEKRKKMIIIAILSALPAFTLAGNDIRLRILNNDMANVVRQSIVLVSITFVIIKFIISIVRKDEFRSLLEEMDADYERFNEMSEQYQDLVEDTIRKTRKVEKSWCFVLLVTTASYPVLAGACTIYSQLFSDDPRRYMVHELKAIIISEEQKYQSPYFELAAEIANVVYSCSWEKVQDSKIRSSICFILAKCQTPVQLRALDMLTFNMELFVSVGPDIIHFVSSRI